MKKFKCLNHCKAYQQYNASMSVVLGIKSFCTIELKNILGVFYTENCPYHTHTQKKKVSCMKNSQRQVKMLHPSSKTLCKTSPSKPRSFLWSSLGLTSRGREQPSPAKHLLLSSSHRIVTVAWKSQKTTSNTPQVPRVEDPSITTWLHDGSADRIGISSN